MNLFAADGKLAKFLNRIGDLILLNIITMIACIPIITAGAAISSMYYVTLLMVKNEEGKILLTYIRAFKDNFKQATMIWIIGGGLSAFLFFDIWLMGQVDFKFVSFYKMVLFVLFLLVLMVTVFTLVVQARYENTLLNTIKNGMLYCAIQFGRSLLMAFVLLIPVILLFLSWRALSVIALLGMSGPAYLTSIYFRDLFQKYSKETN